jgi:UDP-N-acetylglucosamine--dolichyl-phosphate N-acetylglucosaminephosphotransferase
MDIFFLPMNVQYHTYINMAVSIPRDVKKKILCLFVPIIICFSFYIIFLRILMVSKPIQLRYILTNFMVCLVGFGITVILVPIVARQHLKMNLFGYDINKKGLHKENVKIPEAMGLVAGGVFLATFVAFQTYLNLQDFNHEANKLQFWSSFFTIGFALGLGYIDDIKNLPWKAKIFLPTLPGLILLMTYTGGTEIVIPKILQSLLNIEPLYNLGWIYKSCIFLITIFCFNSINIYAGINGLEVGQSIIITLAVMAHNVIQITNNIAPQAHMFSMYMMQPFLVASLGLFIFNWHPALIFVGDTYTYFAGTTLAVAGIHGHFWKTMFFFFIPQLLNFVYSLPQLFKIVPCPRHRLPRFDKESGLLIGSNDMNLINLVLRWHGPWSEKKLCTFLLSFQVLCCVFILVVSNLIL